jgi:hypothetical protein
MNYDQAVYHDANVLLEQLLRLREDVAKKGEGRFAQWEPSLERKDFFGECSKLSALSRVAKTRFTHASRGTCLLGLFVAGAYGVQGAS